MIKRRAEAYWVDARQRWQINVQRDGIRRCFTSYTVGKKGKHECEAKADKWLERFSSDQKLDFALDEYIREKNDTTKAATVVNTVSRVNRIREMMPPKKRLSAISLNDWQRILDTLVKEGKSEGTISLFKVTIMNFVSFCIRNKWDIDRIDSDQLIIKHGAKAKKDKEAYSDEEIRLLLSHELDDIWHINFYRLLLFTGFRRNELCAIKWEDIDFDKKTIHVRRGVDINNAETTGKTENVIRSVALSVHAEKVLMDQRDRLKKAGIVSPYIFVDQSGKRISYNESGDVFRRIKKRGIKHTIHELRHTFISLTDGKLSLALLKKTVGHSASMSTQKTYSHTTQADIDEMRKGVDRAFAEII